LNLRKKSDKRQKDVDELYEKYGDAMGDYRCRRILITPRTIVLIPILMITLKLKKVANVCETSVPPLKK
jgi:hypothetical protein